MGTDDLANVVDDHFLHTAGVLHVLGKLLGFLQAVTMAEEHSVVCSGQAGFGKHLGKLVQGSLTASGLSNGDEPSFVVHMEDRLDVENGAHCCSGGGAFATV